MLDIFIIKWPCKKGYYFSKCPFRGPLLNSKKITVYIRRNDIIIIIIINTIGIVSLQNITKPYEYKRKTLTGRQDVKLNHSLPYHHSNTDKKTKSQDFLANTFNFTKQYILILSSNFNNNINVTKTRFFVLSCSHFLGKTQKINPHFATGNCFNRKIITNIF